MNTEVKEELKEIRKDIQELRNDIRLLIKTCGRMDDHISFVDNVYDHLSHPIQSILNGFRYKSIALPSKEAQNSYPLICTKPKE